MADLSHSASHGSEAELAERLRTHVDRLAGLIGPRHLGAPTALAAAATLVERNLTALGYAVERLPYRVDGAEVANLVAELPGSRRADEIVVLGAHYDTVWCTPGADDNASAVAVLLEVARLMRGCQPQRTVRFVAFPCEEQPHFSLGDMGSQRYARFCREKNERIVGMCCLEMVGYYTSAPQSQQAPPAIPRLIRRFLPTRGDFLHSSPSAVGVRAAHGAGANGNGAG